MQNFEARWKKIKAEKPSKEDSKIEEEIKENLLHDFDKITPKYGRKLLNDVGILILLEWDIANAIVFDVVKKEIYTKYRTKEEAMQAHKGVKYSKDHEALVLWSL